MMSTGIRLGPTLWIVVTASLTSGLEVMIPNLSAPRSRLSIPSSASTPGSSLSGTGFSSIQEPVDVLGRVLNIPILSNSDLASHRWRRPAALVLGCGPLEASFAHPLKEPCQFVRDFV
jgi:hypothetical protein